MTSPSELSLTEAAKKIRAKELSSVELVKSCLKTIEELDPDINAFISLNEKALDEAEEQDQLKPKEKGILSGLPIAVKDLIDAAGMVATQGSSFFRNSSPALEDAPIISRLKKEGAIIIGKTNLHEFAWGGTTDNPHFGTCHNPWNLGHSPGGSSGGSGAAVAARMVPGALGTDTLGSIRIPSSLCGITGLKPTFGLLPTNGIFPLGYTLDHVGPMTRTVADARLLFNGLLTEKERAGLKKIEQGYTLTRAGSKRLKGIRLALFPDYIKAGDCHEDVLKGFNQAIESAVKEGAEKTDDYIPEFELALSSTFTLALAQASEVHRERMAENPQGFGDDVRNLLEMGEAVSAMDYIRAEKTQGRLKKAALKLMTWADVIILPTTSFPAGTIQEPGSERLAYFTGPINILGFPAITIPVGLTHDGLPVSVQLIAAPRREYLLLDIAEVLEERLDFHQWSPKI